MKSFESLLDEIKEIVGDLESGKFPLDESIKKFEKGTKLIRECYVNLESVKKKISIIEEKTEGVIDLKDFGDDEATDFDTGPKSTE